MICPTGIAKSFCRQGWTGGIKLIPKKNFPFRRSAVRRMACVDAPDRNAGNPIRVYTGLGQGFVHGPDTHPARRRESGARA
jgi:hypothetical protein